jgi:hypothetical protein
MTPQEAAHAANTGASGVQEFLVCASPSELEEFCHRLETGVHSGWFALAKIALDVRISDEQAKSAAKMERFTWWLICFTVALVFIGVIQIVGIFCKH